MRVGVTRLGISFGFRVLAQADERLGLDFKIFAFPLSTFIYHDLLQETECQKCQDLFRIFWNLFISLPVWSSHNSPSIKSFSFLIIYFL